MIRESKSPQIANLMQTGGREGMQTLENALNELVAQGAISYQAAAGTAKIWRFRTSGFFVDPEVVLPVYRGHREFASTPPGELLAAYRKIHLFDIAIRGAAVPTEVVPLPFYRRH